MSSFRTLLVDDHQACIDELQCVLKPFSFIKIVGTHTNPLKVTGIVEEERPDLIFLDIEMPGISGLELAGQIREIHKACTVIFVTAYDRYAIQAIKESVYDYLLKPVDPDELEATLNRLLEQNKPDGSFLEKLQKEYDLTQRELEITDLVRKGLSTIQVADRLNISELTVNKHRQNILRKTGCSGFSALLGQFT